jgi:hypothetical protein
MGERGGGGYATTTQHQPPPPPPPARSAPAEPTGPRELTPANIATLRAACDVVDALGPRDRRNLIRNFTQRQLKPYRDLFAPGREGGDTLETVDKRVLWWRRAVRDIENHYGAIFPPHWRVGYRMALEFCEFTRTDLERIMAVFEPPSSAPAEVLLKVLVMVQAFERELSKKFAADREALQSAGAPGRPGDAAGGGPVEWDGDAGGEEEWAFDEDTPLYNDRGQLVDKASGGGEGGGGACVARVGHGVRAGACAGAGVCRARLSLSSSSTAPRRSGRSARQRPRPSGRT